MKKVFLVFASLLIGLSTATASATTLNNPNPKIKVEKKKTNRHTQPIKFVQNGVEFLIFQKGNFDFNTKHKQFNRNNSRRSSINANQRGPNANIKYTANRNTNKGVSISRDRKGKINRIGNVNVKYDKHGRITRAGSVSMSYERGKNSDLAKVGGLKVKYNRKGQITKTKGVVRKK